MGSVASPQGVIRTTPETIPRISISSCRRYSGAISGLLQPQGFEAGVSEKAGPFGHHVDDGGIGGSGGG